MKVFLECAYAGEQTIVQSRRELFAWRLEMHSTVNHYAAAGFALRGGDALCCESLCRRALFAWPSTVALGCSRWLAHAVTVTVLIPSPS